MCCNIKNIVRALVLIEEEEEEELLILLKNQRRNKVSKIFSMRSSEGAYNVTVNRRLFGNEKIFQEYFRLSSDLFESVLRQISDDITRKPYNRNKKPISPREKLSITLR